MDALGGKEFTLVRPLHHGYYTGMNIAHVPKPTWHPERAVKSA